MVMNYCVTTLTSSVDIHCSVASVADIKRNLSLPCTNYFMLCRYWRIGACVVTTSGIVSACRLEHSTITICRRQWLSEGLSCHYLLTWTWTMSTWTLQYALHTSSRAHLRTILIKPKSDQFVRAVTNAVNLNPCYNTIRDGQPPSIYSAYCTHTRDQCCLRDLVITSIWCCGDIITILGVYVCVLWIITPQ
jgi:hypothetical protein